MAGKPKPKALKVLNWDFVKGEKNNMLPMVIQDNHWACVTVNSTEKKGDYEYKEDSFTLDIVNGSGFIASNGDKWLLLCLDWDNAKEVVDISVKDWSSEKWELNKEKTEEALDNWKSTGCLTAIKTNGFTQLELMAEVLNSISFEYRDAKVDLTLTAESIDKDAAKWFIDFQLVNGDVPTLSRTEKDKQVIKNVKSCKSMSFQPTINITDPTDFSDFLLPFEFKTSEDGEANYPNLSINWVPPVIEERKKSGGGWNNGSTVNVSETSPSDRLQFCYTFTGTSTPEELINSDPAYFMTALILSGATLPESYVKFMTPQYVDTYDAELPYQPKKIRSVSKAESNNVHSAKQDEVSTTSNGHKESNPSVISSVDYNHLINEWGNNNPNKLPADLDLSSKSDEWKRMFYSLLTNTIGGKPLVGTDGRSNTVKIKKEFGKSLIELDEDQLGILVERLDTKNTESSDLDMVNF